jgi:RHS repeat-associated protein
VTYGYTLGDLSSTTYPSGRVASMTLLRGRVQAVSLAKDASSTAVALISDVRWEPFERAVSSWHWNTANGPVPHERFYDLSERITRYRLGPVFRDLRYDEASRIASFTHLLPDGTPQPALDQAFTHDENDRLAGITTATSSWSIAYDPNGNRANLSLNGSLSAYNTESTSNRLTSITNPARSFGYDNAGNTVSDSAGHTATYNLRGQVATITMAGMTTTYTYNAFGQRVRKVGSTGAASTVVFVYDQGGHLLGEYDQNGAAIREYVWLRDTPIAMFVPDPANPSGEPLVYYIHTDHLNTPRVVVDTNNVSRWRWFAEPFGTTAPEINPSGLGSFTFNLRFPGQYADPESGLFYNYWRNYDSSKGGYTQSDPIGLAGGSPSTYTYVDGNPLLMVDPDGRNGVWALYRSWRIGQGIGTELYPIIEPGLSPLIDRLLLPDLLLKVPALSPADEAQKDIDNKNYHNTCDKQTPPPNLTPCEEARWRYRQAMSCQKKRTEWEERWGHAGSKEAHERALANVKLRLKNAAEAIALFCTCP